MTRQGKVKAIPVIGMTLEGNEKDATTSLSKTGSIVQATLTYAGSACRDKLSDVFFNRVRRRVSLRQHVLKVI